MAARYKLRFRNVEALKAALSQESMTVTPRVINERRLSVSYAPAGVSPEMLRTEAAEAAFSADQGLSLERIARTFEAEIVPDFQYDLDAVTRPEFLAIAGIEAEEASLADVTTMIRAADAWPRTRGAGIKIAVVDTGVDGTHAEFPAAKRDGGWSVPGDDPWTDWEGHGTMCACIATATRGDGGRYEGVAPDARLIACKTRFYDSELGAIYDYLGDRARAGERIVTSNSFGQHTGTPPAPPAQSDFIPALDDAVAAGVIVVFSAGNNHERAGGGPTACTPNSIWLHKSRADLLAVATCKLDRAMWYYSSRGPGQHFGEAGTNAKPDVTAPTPQNGKILYGGGEQVLQNGWGTSGACPQVAGLAALILAAKPSLQRQEVHDAIRSTAASLQHGATCQGAGLIDCAAAVAVHATS